MKTSWTCLICDRDYQNRREAQRCNDGHAKDCDIPLAYQGIRATVPPGAECPPSLKDSPPMPVESRQVGLTKAQFVEATDAMFLKWLEKVVVASDFVDGWWSSDEENKKEADLLVDMVQEARRRIVRLQNEVEL